MKKAHLTTVTDIIADHGDIYARSVVVVSSSKVWFEYILVDVKTKEKSHKNLSSYGFWRRARDSNPWVRALRKQFSELFLARSGETGTEFQRNWVVEPPTFKAQPKKVVKSDCRLHNEVSL